MHQINLEEVKQEKFEELGWFRFFLWNGSIFLKIAKYLAVRIENKSAITMHLEDIVTELK
jgi:hypothetical protein